ncbi:MAG TPA: response regulator [Candidatus Paceibacterota bacterium]
MPTILFVDDDKFLLDMYNLKFSKNGYEVKTAEGGEEALKMIRDGLEPDILLTDVVMPGLDGIEMVALIRKENLIKKTVIIMLTNQGLPDDVARAKKLNVDGYIIKATTIPSEVLSEVNRIYSNTKALHAKTT